MSTRIAPPVGERLAASPPPTTPPRHALEIRSGVLVARNVLRRAGRDNLTLVAAGVAFYAMTAIFPALAALVSIYGLFADPRTVEQEIGSFSSLLPADSLRLITDALRNFSAKSQSTLNVALLVSVGLALWSAKAGVTSLMTGLNIANETTEKRSFVFQQIIALGLTVGVAFLGIVALAAVALIPAILDFLPLADGAKTALGLGRWPVLAILVCFGLAILYRVGPCLDRARWAPTTWGSVTATVLWLAGSALFSFYVSRFGSYDATYGSLGAPVVLLLWLWLSALIVLVGAEIDAELAHGDGAWIAPHPKRERGDGDL